MTVAELITELQQHPPDTSVRVVVSDEFSTSPPADVLSAERVLVRNQEPYIEIAAEL